MQTTTRELADIIFNSHETELNDMMLESRKYDYEISELISQIMENINSRHTTTLQQLPDTCDQRTMFLTNRIRHEMFYYSRWYDRVTAAKCAGGC